ncbi:Fur family transcriptional regulator [Vulgatibacter incomptus]|uniref:Zinc uptake regulation protein ZUR n=1 Tax=Vulgatibacter incomptus TaxID=1391653 RepID=A0A0K1PFT2_9BACT|nr:Fur family transcriptional regulator [Vulgatibacter incomptus]AKU92393.1 Zinc uptake regulation protein ZUR [Vulgatibacter incomptus]
MDTKASSSEDSASRNLLAQRGLRVTEQRLALLRELSLVPRPISHSELTERLAGAGLDRATVYRNLLSLAEAGILVRTQLGDQVWRYELPVTKGARHGVHPHLVCGDCGQVRCLPADAVSLHGEAEQSEVAEVQLRGRCSPCARGRA